MKVVGSEKTLTLISGLDSLKFHFEKKASKIIKSSEFFNPKIDQNGHFQGEKIKPLSFEGRLKTLR